MCSNIEKNSDTNVIDNGPLQWFVAVVNNNSERKVASKLNLLGYKTYVPTRIEERETRGKVRKVERVLLPSMVFVHCSEEARLKIVEFCFVKRFRVNLLDRNPQGGHPLLVIPDIQMESFRIALNYMQQELICLEQGPFTLGDVVEVKKGELKGLRGNVISLPDGKKQVVVTLGTLASIRLTIPLIYLKKCKCSNK